MTLSFSRRFCFVHIPKTGGESISRAVLPFLAPNDIQLSSTNSLFVKARSRNIKKEMGLEKHSTAVEIAEKIGISTWNRLNSFSVVRDPVDRVVSLYNFFSGSLSLKRHSWIRKIKYLLPIYADEDPDRWPIRSAMIESKTFSEFIRHKKFLSDQASRPQHVWVFNSEGSLIVKNVLGYSNISSSLKTVLTEIGIREFHLAKLNQSKPKICLSGVLSVDRDYLQQLYNNDYVLFKGRF